MKFLRPVLLIDSETPKHIHTQLSQRAEQEGISLDVLVTEMLSAGLEFGEETSGK